MSAVSLLLLYYAYAWAALSMQQFLWSEVHIQFTVTLRGSQVTYFS